MFQFLYAGSNDTNVGLTLKLENMFRGNIYQPKLCTLSHLMRGRKPILAMNQQNSSCALNNVFRGIAKMCMMTLNLAYLCTVYRVNSETLITTRSQNENEQKKNPNDKRNNRYSTKSVLDSSVQPKRCLDAFVYLFDIRCVHTQCVVKCALKHLYLCRNFCQHRCGRKRKHIAFGIPFGIICDCVRTLGLSISLCVYYCS